MELKMTTKKKSKDDEAVIFPEAKVAGITVKPWSFGMLFELSTMLDSVIQKVEQKGMVDDLTSGFISYITMAKLFTIASDEVLKMISLTTGKKEEEIKALDISDGVKLAMVIYEQNKETIKNGLAPLLQKNEEEAGTD